MSNHGWSNSTENRLKRMKSASTSDSDSKSGEIVQFRHRPSELNGNYSFISEILSTAWLPRRLSNKNQLKFTRRYGNVSLTVSSGDYPDGTPIGLPSGSYARKLFISLIDKAFRSQKPLVEFQSIYQILKESGLTPTGKGPQIFREQGLRLSTCQIQIYYKQPNGDYFRYSGSIFDVVELHQVPDQEQLSLIPNRVEFNSRFFTECIQRSSFGYLRKMIHSATNPLAIDLILWITRRMAFVNHDVMVPMSRLKEQFANSEKVRTYDFARNLQRAVDEVVDVTGLRIELNSEGEPGLLVTALTSEQKKRLWRYNPKMLDINAQ